MEKVCPHCHETIDKLFYSASMREYGNCNLEGNDWDSDNTEIDEVGYQCPECNAEVSPSQLLDEVPDEEEDEEPTPSAPPIQTLEESGQTVRNDDEDKNPLMDEYGRGFDTGDNLLAACKHCKIQFVLFEGHATGHSQNCHKCGKTTLTSII